MGNQLSYGDVELYTHNWRELHDILSEPIPKTSYKTPKMKPRRPTGEI